MYGDEPCTVSGETSTLAEDVRVTTRSLGVDAN